jgi:hypothetical protein
MNFLTVALTYIYSKLLLFYPRSFHTEFAEEMQIVFSDSLNKAIYEGTIPFLIVCLKEFGGLPFHVLRESLHEIERKEVGMVNDHSVTEAGNSVRKSRWDSFLGVLPFLLAGVLFIVIRFDIPFHMGYPTAVFLISCLIGLWIGMLRGFPRWTFSFLGWSVVMSYWSMGMPLFTFSAFYDPSAMPNQMGLRAWIPFFIVLGLGLWMGRSAKPLQKLTSAIWHDWTLLSLSIYSFAAFILLIYDENHHPYLLAFITAGTLVICIAIWIFMQSDASWKQVLSLTTGFVIALIVSNISYATWDYATYYHLPPATPQPWYQELLGIIPIILFWVAFVFWPALIGLIRHIVNRNNKPRMAA